MGGISPPQGNYMGKMDDCVMNDVFNDLGFKKLEAPCGVCVNCLDTKLVKPCPFCGQTPKVDYEKFYIGVHVECKNSKCITRKEQVTLEDWNNRRDTGVSHECLR